MTKCPRDSRDEKAKLNREGKRFVMYQKRLIMGEKDNPRGTTTENRATGHVLIGDLRSKSRQPKR